MERNPPPTSDEFIRRNHNKLAQATVDAELQLGRLLSPQRSSWSPNPTERSTSTAYSHTATNSTARDLSSFTARSPMSLSPAVLPNDSEVKSLAKRSISPNKGPVLTERTRSRPSIRRSEIVANKKNQNISGSSVSPSTALTPGRIATTFVPKTPDSQGKSQKSTRTAVGVTPGGPGTSGCRTDTAICTPGSQKSMKSMKTGKETSANKSTKSVKNFGTPLRLTNRSQKSASSKKTPNRPADAARSMNITPRSRSTATAFTPGGLSAVTARSIQNTPGKTTGRNSSLASPTRTARELTAPATPKSGFNAEMSGYSTPGEEIDWERERIERTKNLEMGPPLRIIETTSFSRTPERTVVTALPGEQPSAHTAHPVSHTTSAKSHRSQKSVSSNKIIPLSARTVKPISERTRKKNPSGTTIQAIPPKGKSFKKGLDGNPAAKSQKSAKQKRTSAVQSKKSVSTAKSFKLPSAASTASEIDPEVLREARQNNGTGAMVTSTLPDGSLKVVLQLSVSAAGGRVALAGKAPQGMITTSVVVNGTNIYTAA